MSSNRPPTKLGLIIQGPIISGGMTGLTYGKGRTHAPKSSFVKFDSSEYISKNVAAASKFHAIVISTWNFEDTSRIFISKRNSKKTHLVLCEDPTPNAKKIRSAIKGIPYAHEHNKVRQFHSTLQGLLKLKELGCSHVLKVRTDQLIALELLYEQLKEFAEHNQLGLIVPGLRAQSPLIINDFYFGGSISDLEMIANLMCNLEFQFHDNVHIDLFYKTIWAYPSKSIGIPYINFFLDNGGKCKNLGNYFNFISKELFHPSSRAVYSSIKWRGEPLTMVQQDMIFSDSVQRGMSPDSHGSILSELNYEKALSSFFGDKSLFKFLISFIHNSQLIRLRNFRRELSTYRDVHHIRFR